PVAGGATMNRLFIVSQHPALVRAAQQTCTNVSNNLASVSTFSSLLSGNWFSTATAAPQPATSGDDAQRQPSVANSASNAGQLLTNRLAAASAHTAADVAATPATSSSSSLPTPPSPGSLAAQPQPLDHDGGSGASAAAAPLPELQQPQPQPGSEPQLPGSLAQQSAPPQLLQVVPTPEGAPRDKLMMRDFIQNSLYHPTLGYFNAPTPPVGSVGGPINYWKIYCRDEFNILVKKKYQELETSFLTPAELFSPWYGACIARHMVEHRRHHLGMEGQPLVVVEVGGGNGTLARDILDWLRDNRPQDYRQTSYTCLEISTSLAARQYDKVVRQGGHGGHFHLRRGSGLDPATWGGEVRWEHTFVLMMEVLDNLPHDRVFRRRPSDPWQQTVVRPLPASSSSSSPSSSPSSSLESGPWEEVGEPLTDPLLARTLAAVYRPPTREQQLDERFNRVLDFILAREAQPTSRDEVLWVPTAAASFLELLHTLRPNHSLIAADFDKLPDVQLPGRNAPLVAEKIGGRNIDHPSVLVPWGRADIFFPTDFDAMCKLYRAAAEYVWGPGGIANTTTASTSTASSVSSTAPAASSTTTTSSSGTNSTTSIEGTPAAAGAEAAAAAAAAAARADAEAAAAAAAALGDVNAEHFRQGAVVKRYREMFNTATICAFNPMVDDFVNARFFFGDSKNRLPPGQRAALLQQQQQQQQAKSRLPSAPASLASGIKAHIPAAPAAKVRARLQQQQVQQQQQEPVLGGRRQRGGGGGGGGRGGGGR
ncbi:hypothetical protein Agub_g15325, partial [Astrephomene gubernaculifera]